MQPPATCKPEAMGSRGQTSGQRDGYATLSGFRRESVAD